MATESWGGQIAHSAAALNTTTATDFNTALIDVSPVIARTDRLDGPWRHTDKEREVRRL
jgi:hypothetical protein